MLVAILALFSSASFERYDRLWVCFDKNNSTAQYYTVAIASGKSQQNRLQMSVRGLLGDSSEEAQSVHLVESRYSSLLT